MAAVQDLWTFWCWAITGGAPFTWTISVSGLNGRNVTAEASLTKVASSWGDPRHAKASVYSMAAVPTAGGQPGYSNWWGPDGAPVRYLANCSYMRFGLEVQRSYAEMVGKIHVH